MIRTAFVPGAGLGKRLRPLTSERPKPLVPVWNRPLIAHVFDALIEVGIERFVVNTHHCPEAYDVILGAKNGVAQYREREVRLIHEPVLLETGGGLRNARALLGDGPVLIHNGDVLANLNLRGLIERHIQAGAEVTLLLRGKDGPLQVRYADGWVRDFRDALSVTEGVPTLMTGAYVIEPAFLDRIPESEIISVVPVFLEMLRAGFQIAGLLDESGTWADLGTRDSYLDAHRGRVEIDSTADVAPDVEFRGFAAVGPEARIGSGAVVEDSVIWENAEIASGSRLRACIVRDGRQVSGEHAGKDF